MGGKDEKDLEAIRAAMAESLDVGTLEKELTSEFEHEYAFNHADLDALSLKDGLATARRKIHFDDLRADYTALWAEMAIRGDRIPIVGAISQQIYDNRDRYRAVEQITRVPWYVVAVIHALEAGLRFDRHLHNGDPLTGRTTHVPAGRPRAGQPPFTWEESAEDALAYDGLSGSTNWSIEYIAYLLEGFNGWGYRLYHPAVKSPYLWSFSNHYSQGKYVADGKWSSTAVSKQCGAMTILRYLTDQGIIRPSRSVELEIATGRSRSGGNEDAVDPDFDERQSDFIGASVGSDIDRIPNLIQCGSSVDGLRAARLEAARHLREYPHNGCAAHLSALLRQAGIGVRMELSAGNLSRLIERRGWTRVAVGTQRAGDVGVTYDYDPTPPGADHIYLVVSTNGSDEMQIADNQRMADHPHVRFASGRGGKTPTEYFLRAN